MIQFTSNGGINWINQISTGFNNYGPFTPFFVNYNTGWAGTGGNRIYATTNGGQIWEDR